MSTEITPTGKFRVGLNGSNATHVIVNADGTISGLSADLGNFIARKLSVPFEPVLYASSAPFTRSTSSCRLRCSSSSTVRFR